jgi:acetyl-CoA/propionyl-CoA carboxylase carboxyl transferase subunit
MTSVATSVGDDTDQRVPKRRLAALLGPGFTPLHAADGQGVLAVHGYLGGTPVIAYCTDGTIRGGALGAANTSHIVAAIDHAVKHRLPVIGLWHSGGASLAEGVASMDAVGRMFAAMIRASGIIPQVSVVLGPAAGAAAYGPALNDVIILAESGRMFVTGPQVVQSVTGESIDMAGLGGGEAHGRKSGVAHLIAGGEADAYEQARQVTDLLARPGEVDLALAAERHDFRALLPDSPRRAYDVRPLLRALLDPGFVEFQPRWATNMTVGLGRLAGRAVGVLANNPLHKGGCLDSLSAEKASRFVRMCDCFGIPLLVVVDVPGYLPGVGQEWSGVIRRGAKLLYAFSEAVVPRYTLITRKAYGGAYIAMNSRSLGATGVFAWPDAQTAIMGAEAAVAVLHRKRLAEACDDDKDALLRQLAAEHQRRHGGVSDAVGLGSVDAVIDPADTRWHLARVLADAPVRRGGHGNIPL